MDALPLRTSNDVHHAKQEQMKHKTWKYMQQTYNIDEKAKAHIFGLLLAQTNIRSWLSHIPTLNFQVQFVSWNLPFMKIA